MVDSPLKLHTTTETRGVLFAGMGIESNTRLTARRAGFGSRSCVAGLESESLYDVEYTRRQNVTDQFQQDVDRGRRLLRRFENDRITRCKRRRQLPGASPARGLHEVHTAGHETDAQETEGPGRLTQEDPRQQRDLHQHGGEAGLRVRLRVVRGVQLQAGVNFVGRLGEQEQAATEEDQHTPGQPLRIIPAQE